MTHCKDYEGVKQEIINTLDKTLSNNTDKERNKHIILAYYGYGEDPYPTYQSIADTFRIKRQRIEQIIRNYFKKPFICDNSSCLSKVAGILEKYDIIFSDDFLRELSEKNLIEDKIHIRGLLRLLHEVNLAIDHEIYNLEIVKAEKRDHKYEEDLLLIKPKHLKTYHSLVKDIKTKPGQLGLCNLNEYCEKHKTALDVSYLKRIISKSKCSWTYQSADNQFWYLFEDRDNVIINNLEKIATLANNIRLDILSEVLHSSLHYRSSKFKLPLPGKEILKEYLLKSKFIKTLNDYCLIVTEKANFNEIEKKIITFYKSNPGFSCFRDLSTFLRGNNFTKAHIEKCYYSPLIYTDKSKGRGYYRFCLISDFSAATLDNAETGQDQYTLYLEKLKLLYQHTDVTVEDKRRREQYILCDYLFKDKTTERCAICGKKYSVDSLVTAHKKKRSECSENERTDPNIVMPLCKFGCDYLYEKRFIIIRDGKVQQNNAASLTETEKKYIKTLEGNELIPCWKQGKEDYFL